MQGGKIRVRQQRTQCIAHFISSSSASVVTRWVWTRDCDSCLLAALCMKKWLIIYFQYTCSTVLLHNLSMVTLTNEIWLSQMHVCSQCLALNRCKQHAKDVVNDSLLVHWAWHRIATHRAVYPLPASITTHATLHIPHAWLQSWEYR